MRISAIIGATLMAVFTTGTVAAQEGDRFNWYDTGWVPFQAAQIDARFPYLLYVPRDYDPDGAQTYPLVVLVHGTERGPRDYLRHNVEFAEEENVILLAPLFPFNSHGNLDLENYKLIDYEGTRYDLVLLSIVDEVASKYRLSPDNRFNLFGFSGGGHFTHRFYYLHPHRLNAISIGAPGMVTLLNDPRPWWVGTGDLKDRFNARLDFEQLRRVKVHMVIGAEDNQEWSGEVPRNSQYFLEGVDGASFTAAGRNRIERMRTLRQNFEDNGIVVEMVLVPGAGHETDRMFPAMQDFFREAIVR